MNKWIKQIPHQPTLPNQPYPTNPTQPTLPNQPHPPIMTNTKTTPPTRLQPTLKSNDISLGKVIGKGSYGTVYSALMNNQPVAVKEMSMKHTSTKSAIREIALLMHLKHTNCCIKLLYIVGKLNSRNPTIHLVFELAQMDLHCAITWSKLNLNTCIDYSWQLIKILEHLNHHGIIHRDIKPSNILIVNTKIVLADFGMSRTAGSTKNHSECNTGESSQASQASQLTYPPQPPMTDGRFLCTLYYKPPEIALRCPHHTTAADTWSGGCVITEMFLQTPLFSCASIKQLISKFITTIGLPDAPTQRYFQRGQEMAFPWNNVIDKSVGTAVDKSFPNVFDNSESGCAGDTTGVMSKIKHQYPRLNIHQLSSLLKGMLRWHPNDRTNISQLVDHPFFNDIAKHSRPVHQKPLAFYKSVIELVDAGNCAPYRLKSELRKLVRKINITSDATHATRVVDGTHTTRVVEATRVVDATHTTRIAEATRATRVVEATRATESISLYGLSLESTIDSLVQRGKQLNSKIRFLRKSGDMNEHYNELVQTRTLNNKSLQTSRRQLSKSKTKIARTKPSLDEPTPMIPIIPMTHGASLQENIAVLVNIISDLTSRLKGVRKIKSTNQLEYQTLMNKRDSYRKELNKLRYHIKKNQLM